jgi:hypothetical protein
MNSVAPSESALFSFWRSWFCRPATEFSAWRGPCKLLSSFSVCLLCVLKVRCVTVQWGGVVARDWLAVC